MIKSRKRNKKMKDMNKYMPLENVAVMFGVSTQTVRNWIKSGILEGIIIDNRNKRHEKSYVTTKSIKRIENDLIEIADYEKNVTLYKEQLIEAQKNYKDQLDDFKETTALYLIYSKEHNFIKEIILSIFVFLAKENQISEREYIMLTMFLNGYSLGQIGEEFDLTNQRIKVILFSVIKKAQKFPNYQLLLNENKRLKSALSFTESEFFALKNKYEEILNNDVYKLLKGSKTLFFVATNDNLYN